MTDTPDGRRVRLPERALEPFVRFSLYNSPYPAHDRGCAVDLYRDPGRKDDVAPSPVAGTVLDSHERRVPRKEYAETTDHILLVDVDAAASGFDAVARAGHDDDDGYVARMLHVDPAVEPGDRVAVGDPLGRLVRSGFFAPWVDDHVHLGFRRPDQHLLRAGGSLPLSLPVDPRPLEWDGAGTVVETGETYVVLDAPTSEAGEWVGVAADGGGVLDGGLAHYEGGGLLGGRDRCGPVSFLGYEVGSASGRTVEWESFDVLANGERVTGLSLFCARDRGFGAKVVHPGHDLRVGDRAEVGFRPREDPIRLG
ncbi:MAG: hypothetical protein V5A62_00800 [Haloarculaceae archaeon]